jgi:hypothetical protein
LSRTSNFPEYAEESAEQRRTRYFNLGVLALQILYEAAHDDEDALEHLRAAAENVVRKAGKYDILK